MTTDIIVGFPGETGADFEETLALLDEVQYDGVFAFKYSPRPNTPAIAMADSIPDEEKSRGFKFCWTARGKSRERITQSILGQKLK